MSDAVDRGITVIEMAPMDQAIDALRETTAAFIGRALRGPLNEPILISSFGDFRRRFGDVWSRSSLGPAVQQFFEHGGDKLYIIRVANNARGAMICLPASGSALVLRALEPGSTERIRAAVDFDAIDVDNDQLFNLTLQRVDPTTELVIDQELYRQVNYREDAERFIVNVLLTSSLVRVEQPIPSHRPEATVGALTALDTNYVQHTQAGTDGTELSDYDLIGSRRDETGLFALQKVDSFDVLYLPPPGKGRDLGPTSILAAERYCRERGAMLIMDPSSKWTTPDDAIDGIRKLGFASPNMVSYFPRMRHRYDADIPSRAAGGAMAGLLCKLDRNYGAWSDLDQHGVGFNRNLVPAVDVDDEAMQSLSRHGVNSVRKGPLGSARLLGSVTMARGSESHRDFANLPVRRLSLQIVSAIDKATRWAVFELDDTRLAERIRRQVTAYLDSFIEMGALESERIFVECDAGLCKRGNSLEHGVTILIVFQPVGSKEPISVTMHQTVAGCRVASTAFAPV